MRLDEKRIFMTHMEEAAKKAERTGVALSHLMGNVGNPRRSRRRLYTAASVD